MSGAALPGIFYLHDPQDGVSQHLLTSIGVHLHRGVGSVEFACSALHFQHDKPATELFAAGTLPLTAEHRNAFSVAYFVSGGGAVVDVRDSANAFIRILLHDGDAAVLDANVYHRCGTKDAVLHPATIPVWGDNPDVKSRASTVVFGSPVAAGFGTPGCIHVLVPPAATATSLALRFEPGSVAEYENNRNYWQTPGTPHMRSLVSELCESFYALGWVTGTGGSISIRHGDRIFMAPSGVQKERMQAQDIFVLDTSGRELYSPSPLPDRPRLKLSQCAPLFQHAFTLRGAGACIHTHDMNAVMVTLLAGRDTEFRITHQEMIKGIAGHGFNDTCVVPIIENTPHECDLAESLGEAMRRYPKANAVLVRRHGVYVWGSSWEAAKTQAECYHYLFECAVRMRSIGIDPGALPSRVENGIGADRSYGSGKENYGAGSEAGVGHVHTGTCCGGVQGPSGAGAGPVSSGFHGAAGTATLGVSAEALAAVGGKAALSPYSHVLLDIEGCTTSLSFVTDILFPYASSHVDAWLRVHWGEGECAADVAALVKLSQEDVAAGSGGPPGTALPPSVSAACHPRVTEAERTAALGPLLANIAWQMGMNRKTGALKQLQGHIWRDGYACGDLRGQVYEDVPLALQAWRQAGKKSYIYSSGSREAQRLLFKHSEAGDMRGLLDGYFDTTSGPKVEASSYSNIALSLGVDKAGDILFCTDSLAEAVAAHAAGIQVVITERPGNAPLQAGQPFPVTTSLLQLTA